MYLCREVAGLSPQIGEEFGKEIIQLVMHACNKIEKEIKTNSNTKLIVESVKKIISDKIRLYQFTKNLDFKKRRFAKTNF